MCFIVNTAFTNYIDQFNLTEKLKLPFLTNKTTSEHTLNSAYNEVTFNKNWL